MVNRKSFVNLSLLHHLVILLISWTLTTLFVNFGSCFLSLYYIRLTALFPGQPG